MKHITRKFYILYFLLATTFIFIFYFVLSNLVENRIERQERERLDEDIISLTEYINKQSLNKEADEIIKNLKAVVSIVNERVVFLDPTGQILYDSKPNAEDRGNLFNDFEIGQILKEEMYSVTDSVNINSPHSLYSVAQAFYDDTGQPIGILSIRSEIPDLTAILRLLFILLLIGMFILATLLFLLLKSWLKQITSPIDEMQNVLSRLSEAEYGVRYIGHSYEEMNRLGYSMNELAENLEQQQLELKASEERIYGLINHLIIGVMLLDENRQIRMVNPVMNQMLNTDFYEKINHLYTDYIRSAELIELIETSYLLNTTVHSEISIYFPEEKILDTNIVPIPGKEEGAWNYVVLLYDITEIRQLENIRTDFTANVSHELRTPITALKGFSETLLMGAMHDEEVLVEFLEIMLKESTRLDAMVQDILQLAKLEKRQFSVSREHLKVRDVVEEVFQMLQQKMEQKKMLSTIEESIPTYIYANKDQLKQILVNLIANAIIYTPEEGKIHVNIKQKGKDALIEVRDNGIGIPKEDQDRIFERFYRVDKARSRNSGGTGLGLSIVKWLVDNMEGQVELESEVNVGTTFKVTLPLEQKPKSVNRN